jgi:hypothetical protein
MIGVRSGGNIVEVGGSSPSPRIMKIGITWGERLGRPECPYMRRWVLNAHWLSLRLHHWYSSDDHRAFHDHSWWFVTLVLKGRYVDVSPSGREPMRPGAARFRPAPYRHTVEVAPGGCWTLVLTGRRSRRWGFYPDGRFRRANKYFAKYGHHPCVDR